MSPAVSGGGARFVAALQATRTTPAGLLTEALGGRVLDVITRISGALDPGDVVELAAAIDRAKIHAVDEHTRRVTVRRENSVSIF